MAEQYEVDFKELGDAWMDKYDDAAAVKNAEEALKSGLIWQDKEDVIKDIIGQYSAKNMLSPSQKQYLLRMTSRNTPEYAEHKENFFAWYNSRPDVQELYRYSIGKAWYIPADGRWLYKGAEGWNTAWESAPDTAEMFFRAATDYAGREFRELKRPTVYNEGDLVVLRSPFVGSWQHDPYYEGSKTPDATNLRIGTVMAHTEKFGHRSRAGKGSRNISVLWIGTSEPKLLPERMIKSHERKRRTKKKV